MSHASELHTYIARLQQRMRTSAWLRGTAIFFGTALGVTVVLVLVLNHLAFPARGVVLGRLAIVLALASAAVFGLVTPLKRLTRGRAVARAEAANPELSQRLTTFAERSGEGGDNPFLELLAADTLRHTEEAAPAVLVPDNRLFALSGAAAACLGMLVWIIAAGPGYLGYGASLLWTGARKDAAPYYVITVTPGNVTVRRNSDQLIVARVTGMQPARAQLFAHFQSTAGWEPVTMQSSPDAGGGASYQFVLAGLPENVEYYVAAGPLISAHYKVRVVDLPGVKQINVSYHYPQWTGLKAVTEEHSGDLRAIEGTDAQIEIQTDRPLKDGSLTLDSGQTIALTGGANNVYRGTIHMEKDGAYHVAATDEGQAVRLSEDYFIATDKAQPPQVAIDRPAGDYRASPIEEVTVGVKATDDYGLKDVHLHYAVNGGADHDISLLNSPGAKDADGKHMISLEELKLAPGDVIAIYATARDGHSQAQTDISFIQVDPFEREFSQSQQAGGGSGGGGGGGGGDQTEISKREKELIAATWKQENDKDATAKDNTVQGQFLSDAQQKLRDQVNALSIRMQSRDISQANQEFTDFDRDMQAAAAAMGPSAEKLKATQWKNALPEEQKALQALLRAEATFRKIEVAFGQRGGGGGGGGGSTGRDLASLFDLELDTEKNQYETAQTASPAEQHEKEVEDALEKLDALARRQEDLANQPHDPQQSFQQRWQQEMLRREAEQLQRQMEQLAKNNQQQQGANGSQAQPSQRDSQEQSSQPQGEAQGQSESTGAAGQSQQQSASAGSGGQGQSQSQAPRNQSGGQSSQDQHVEEALRRLNQATGMMNRNGSQQQSAEDERAVAERLREAQDLLAGSQQQMAGNKVDSMAHEAGELSQEERSQAARIDKLVQDAQQMSSSSDASSPDLDKLHSLMQERDALASERQQLSDELSKLQANMRNAARGLAANQPETAKRLRDALTEMDDTDLDNHVQRTADWLRSGINPNSNGTENEIAHGLSKLSQQLQQAQTTMAQEKPGGGKGQGRLGQGDPSEALDKVERLRSELEATAGTQGGRGGQARQNGTGAGGQQYSDGQLSRNGRAGGGQQQAGGNGDASGQGADRNGFGGDTRAGGGGDGAVWGNFDTGNNTPHARGQQQAAPRDAAGNPADTERSIGQEMRQLQQLRQMIGNDPQAAKEIEALTRQMQNLDPSRFPGNPAMVEQMHREVLSSVDRLELELQRANAETDARTGKPDTVPAGYQEQVADYYRRLSKK